MPPEKTDNPIASRLGASLFRPQNMNRIAAIELSRIRINPNQPRKFFDEAKLKELALSLKEKGQLQPILVKANEAEPDTFLIVAGERRFRASQLNDASTIECIITQGDIEEIALIENLQRDDLKPIEEAEAIKHLMDERGYSQGRVANLLGTTRVAINEIVALTKLPAVIRDACRESDRATKSFLLSIARLDSEEQQLQAWDAFIGGAPVTVARAMKIGEGTDSFSRFAGEMTRFTQKVKRLKSPTDEQKAVIMKAKKEFDRAVKQLLENSENQIQENEIAQKAE